MFDAKQLLSAMMSGGMRGSPLTDMLGGMLGGSAPGGGAQSRAGFGQQAGGGNPLGSLLGGLFGGGGAARTPGASSGGGLGDLLGGLLGGGQTTTTRQSSAGSPIADIAGALFGGGRSGGGMGAGMGGGMAMLSGLAAMLLRNNDTADDVPPPEEAAQRAETADDAAEKAMLMIRGMIAAAQADGRIDASEQEKILGRAREAGAGAEEQDYLKRALTTPIDPEALVAEVRDRLTAAQLYMASAMAITADTDAERAYLAALAKRLNLKLPA